MAGRDDSSDKQGLGFRAQQPSIAVLPLFCFPHGTISRGFGQGLAFSITSALMPYAELNVISASSTMGYWEHPRATSEIAGRLGARYLVFGQVVQADQLLTLKVGFLDAASGREVDFDPIEVHISALHNIEGLVVARVISAILPHMRAADIEKDIAKPPRRSKPRVALLAALPALHTPDRLSLEEAERLLRAELEVDPDSAVIYAWLARLYALRISHGWVADRRQACLDALRLARIALSLDPDNAVALTTAGHFHSYLLKETDTGLEMMRRAVALAPSEPYAWLMLATTLAYVGDAGEARRHAEHALSLSPLDAHVGYFHTFLGVCHYADENYAEAARHCRLSLETSPLYSTTWRLLAVSLVGLGQLDEAREAAKEMLAIEPNYPNLAEESAPFLVPTMRARYLSHLAEAGLLPRR